MTPHTPENWFVSWNLVTPWGYLMPPRDPKDELMPKKEVFDFKSAPRAEQVEDHRPKQMEDRKHRLGGCADSALIARIRPDAIFGNDRG